MKTQRRHDLKSNELAASLGRLSEGLREHGSKVLAVVLVGVLVVLGGVMLYSSKRQSRLQLWEQLYTAVNSGPAGRAEDLLRVAQEAGNDQLAGWAWKSYGDRLVLEHVAKSGGEGRSVLAEAERAYQTVLDRYGSHEAAAGARVGLAVVYENLGKWGEARALYKELASDGSAAGTGLETLALSRVTQLDRWRALSDGIRPATGPTTKPGRAAELDSFAPLGGHSRGDDGNNGARTLD